jgi:hypothetical protein
MHESLDGRVNIGDLRRCRVCDYIAYRFPCSTATIRDEAVLGSLNFDIFDTEDKPDS